MHYNNKPLNCLNQDEIIESLPGLKLYEIAEIIYFDIRVLQKKQVYFGAVPYLQALNQLETIEENYGLDSGRSIVLYLLGNLQTYKGEIARNVKKQLKKLANIK